MEIIIGILLIFYLLLLEKVLEIKEQLNKFEKEMLWVYFVKSQERIKMRIVKRKIINQINQNQMLVM
jgi:hypothetical protein